jgi:hypothetical protein
MTNFSFHAKNVSQIESKEARQYLRHLLLLKEAYVKFDDEVRELGIDELLASFSRESFLGQPAFRASSLASNLAPVRRSDS